MEQRKPADGRAGTLAVLRTVIAVRNRPVLREATKTESSRRTMRIPQELVTVMRAQRARINEQMLQWGKDYQRDPLFVFPGLAGTPMTPMSLTDRLGRLCARVGISGSLPCHSWRHTAATQLLHSGTDIKTVQTRLGHATPAITMALYIDPDEEKDAGAAEHLGAMLERKQN